MKLLSAKNKKYGLWAAAAIGALFVFASIYGTYKTGSKNIGDYLKQLWADIKSLISFQSVVILLGVGFALIGLHESGAVLAVAIGTLTTGAAVVSTFNTTYLPEFFSYTAATQLTGVKITVQGEGVIFDSDANGLNHCGVNRVLGQPTNTYIFRISNGLIKGKNVIWEFTNSAAQTPVVYVDNHETAGMPFPAVGKVGGQRMYLQLIRQAILANSGQDFTDFATLSVPSIAATDQINVLYGDGTQQQMNRADLQAKLAWSQNIVNTPVYMLDNYAQTLSKVNIIAAAAQTAYIQRWVAADQGGMISQVINN